MSTTISNALGSSPLRTRTPVDDSQGNPVLSPTARRAEHPLQGVRDDVADALATVQARYARELSYKAPERHESAVAASTLAVALRDLDTFIKGATA